MTDSRFLWLGRSSLQVEMVNMAEILPAAYVDADPMWRPRVLFASGSRIPKSVITPERLAGMVKDGTAALDDAGIPGPRRADVAQCHASTVALNQRGEDETFKAALKEIYRAARDGHEEE